MDDRSDGLTVEGHPDQVELSNDLVVPMAPPLTPGSSSFEDKLQAAYNESFTSASTLVSRSDHVIPTAPLLTPGPSSLSGISHKSQAASNEPFASASALVSRPSHDVLPDLVIPTPLTPAHSSLGDISHKSQAAYKEPFASASALVSKSGHVVPKAPPLPPALSSLGDISHKSHAAYNESFASASALVSKPDHYVSNDHVVPKAPPLTPAPSSLEDISHKSQAALFVSAPSLVSKPDRHGYANSSVSASSQGVRPTPATPANRSSQLSAEGSGPVIFLRNSPLVKVLRHQLNNQEASLQPDEHCVAEDPLLKSTPYIVNLQYKVLICTVCQHSIKPALASQHLRKSHTQCKVGSDFCQKLEERFPQLVSEPIHPSEVVEAVFGLAIPETKYTICARCRRGYLNLHSWHQHPCRNPGGDLGGRPKHFLSFVQTFFSGTATCYFPVRLPIPGPCQDSDNDFNIFKSNFQELVVDKVDRSDDDYRVLNQFLLKEGWIKHISPYSPSELSPLVALPKEGELLRPLSRHVINLMTHIQTAIGAAGYHVRRLLGRRPRYVGLTCSWFLTSILPNSCQ